MLPIVSGGGHACRSRLHMPTCFVCVLLKYWSACNMKPARRDAHLFAVDASNLLSQCELRYAY